MVFVGKVNNLPADKTFSLAGFSWYTTENKAYAKHNSLT